MKLTLLHFYRLQLCAENTESVSTERAVLNCQYSGWCMSLQFIKENITVAIGRCRVVFIISLVS